MTKTLLSLLLFAFVAYGQQKRVIITNIVDEGDPPLKAAELSYLTERLQQIAAEVLPQQDYDVRPQRIPEALNADYISRGRIGRFGEGFTIKVELYESEKKVAEFSDGSRDVFGLLSVLNEKAPVMFKKMLPEEPAPAPASTSAPVAASVATIATAYTGTNKCYKQIFDLTISNANFDMQNFIKDLGISVAKTQGLCKSKFTCPADDKMTDVGLTAGCLKQLPTSPNEIINVLKEIGLNVGTDAVTQAASKKEPKVDKEKTFFEIGYLYTYGNQVHSKLLRLSFGWFYGTIGEAGIYTNSDAIEWIVGGISRWTTYSSPKLGFGLFGGLGARHWKRHSHYNDGGGDPMHELGVEAIVGIFSVYLSERNFNTVGLGAGLIF